MRSKGNSSSSRSAASRNKPEADSPWPAGLDSRAAQQREHARRLVVVHLQHRGQLKDSWITSRERNGAADSRRRPSRTRLRSAHSAGWSAATLRSAAPASRSRGLPARPVAPVVGQLMKSTLPVDESYNSAARLELDRHPARLVRRSSSRNWCRPQRLQQLDRLAASSSRPVRLRIAA